MGNKLVIYKPAFKLNALGHGGDKRSAQVYELLQPLHPQLYGDIRLPKAAQRNSFQSIKAFVAFVNWLRSQHAPLPLSGQFFKKLYEAFKIINYLKPRLLVLENTNLVDYYIADAARYCKAFVCIIPHNIESLVATQFSPHTHKKSPYWLEEELTFLRRADLVYAISKYDQWLFSCNNINTALLPYTAPQPVLQTLLSIRNSRAETVSEPFILILGTVKNQPTREGLRQLVDFLENNKVSDTAYVLAGYEVEKHFSQSHYSHIEVKGTVSEATLNQLMTTCRCVLIHHQPSSGALTRVTECLAAGIPVVGNFFAVKEVINETGVYQYNDFRDLQQILNKPLENPRLPDTKSFDGAFLTKLAAV